MRKRLILVAVLLLGWQSFAAAGLAAAPPASDVRAGHLQVMTQNLYVGADIFRIFDAQTPAQIPVVVAGILATVFDTDFPARAEQIADEIARLRPHLIGLQEVSLLRVQSPGDFLLGNPVAAETVLFDYLGILLDALAARGLDYRAAAVVENADIELPMLVGFSGGGPLLDDVRLTDRDVILARGDVATADPMERNFAVNLVFPIAGVTVEFLRGFTAVDATVAGRSYRFVNTHLELSSPIPVVQAAQAFELLAELSGEALPVIVVGDLNSAPDDPPGLAYSQFAAEGFADTWLLRSGPSDPGFTCCQAETLDNPISLLDERIDHIFVHTNLGGGAMGAPPVGPVRELVITGERGDELTGERWPSDHAGVYAGLILRQLKP